MTIEFEGNEYFDDRMFVFHICKCVVEEAENGLTATTVFHENPPSNSRFCLVTYRNVARYPAFRVDDFDSESAAREYLEHIEPTTPRVSLGGRSPAIPMTYSDWQAWKEENACNEYDYSKMFLPGGRNPKEYIMSPKRARRRR